MVRRKQLHTAAQEYAGEYASSLLNEKVEHILHDAFMDGAEWAGKHPTAEIIWHDMDTIPERQKESFLVANQWWAKIWQRSGDTFDNISFKYYNYEWSEVKRGCPAGTMWAYIKDLLPKSR